MLESGEYLKDSAGARRDGAVVVLRRYAWLPSPPSIPSHPLPVGHVLLLTSPYFAHTQLQKHFPAQATRLARLDKLEQDLQHKLARKRRLSTQHMVGPDVAPATQTLRIYVHHRLVRSEVSSSLFSSSRASGIGSRSRGGNGGNGGGGGEGPSWALRIEGGVLQAAAGAGSAGGGGGPCLNPHYNFTEFFDRVTVMGLQQEVVPRRGGGAVGGGTGEEGDEVEVCRAEADEG